MIAAAAGFVAVSNAAAAAEELTHRGRTPTEYEQQMDEVLELSN